MPRIKRQILSLKIALGILVTIFFGGVVFELGRYVSRLDTDLPIIGSNVNDSTDE